MFLNIVNTLWKPFTIGRVGAVTPKLLVNMKNIRKAIYLKTFAWSDAIVVDAFEVRFFGIFRSEESLHHNYK